MLLKNIKCLKQLETVTSFIWDKRNKKLFYFLKNNDGFVNILTYGILKIKLKPPLFLPFLVGNDWPYKGGTYILVRAPKASGSSPAIDQLCDLQLVNSWVKIWNQEVRPNDLMVPGHSKVPWLLIWYLLQSVIYLNWILSKCIPGDRCLLLDAFSSKSHLFNLTFKNYWLDF